MLSAEEAERWAEFKQLRNDLSHKYLDAALSARLEKLCAGFMQAAIILEDRIDAASPVVSLQQGNVYRAVHKDGRIVDIDYAERRILSVSRVMDTSAANRSPAPASDNAAHLRPSAAASSRPSASKTPSSSLGRILKNIPTVSALPSPEPMSCPVGWRMVCCCICKRGGWMHPTVQSFI